MKKNAFLFGLLTFLFFSTQLNAQDTSTSENLIAGQYGVLPEPEKIKTVLSAGNPADIFLLALTPEKLLGFAYIDMKSPSAFIFPQSLKNLPKLGRLTGRSSTLSLESLFALNPDIIIDIGSVNETYLSDAKRISEQTGIPYVLTQGRLIDTPQQLRQLGRLLDVDERAETLANHAEKMLARAAAYKAAHAGNLKAYYGRGSDGLETGFTGSMHTEAMEALGLINVAQAPGFTGIAKVSMEQVLGWNPDIIITQDENFYRLLQQDSVWKNVKAVKDNRIYFVPGLPFGWLDVPPSLNRLLGLRWLEAQLTPAAQEGLIQDISDFFRLFYHSELQPYQIEKMLNHSITITSKSQ